MTKIKAKLNKKLTTFRATEQESAVKVKVDTVIVEETRRKFLVENLRRARNRKSPHAVLITVDDLLGIGNKQNWKCAITGDQLEFVRGGNFNNNGSNALSCSIDRIDTTRPYTVDNVQLVTWQSNSAKSGMTEQELTQWIKRAYNTIRRNSKK